MPVYTRPDRREPIFADSSLKEQPAPLLLFQKWQAWDNFRENNFDRTNCRLDYLKNIISAVQNTYNEKYAGWLKKYKQALESQGVEMRTYSTVWRLLIGWGNNPTLESGLNLHHLYGFPYIPGSAVKGVVHHTAEMEVMDLLDVDLVGDTLPPEKIEAINNAVDQLRLIRILFGSIHLEQAQNKAGKPIGPECPQSFLKKLRKHISQYEDTTQEIWKKLNKKIDEVLDDHTGAMLRFYDAVPGVNEYDDLLQPDIVNCHYSDYYSTEGKMPPSDDQSPIPVTFLAVKPGTEFIFSYRIEGWPVAETRDEDEKYRNKVLLDSREEDLLKKVQKWLEKALGEWGIGAKTAAGYGYFDTGIIEHAISNDSISKDSGLEEPSITPVEPGPFSSTIKPQSKLSGISKPFKPEIWNNLAEQPHIAKIVAQKYSAKIPKRDLPARQIIRDGKGMLVFYKNDRFYCEVELKLQGIGNSGEAQYLWENIIAPELNKD